MRENERWQDGEDEREGAKTRREAKEESKIERKKE